VFYWRSTIRPSDEGLPVVEVAFTRRGVGARGGSAARSAGPFGALNLGGHVGDDPVSVEDNRAALAGELGIGRDRLLFMRQVHGTSVHEVSSPWQGEAPEADGMITTAADLALVVLVADCVPVLLHDGARGVVAAVHAGRPGMVAGVVPAAVRRMRALGARDISAVVGPSVCGRCYEVPAEMVDAAAAVSPASVARSWSGTPAIDVAAGVVEQLATDGVAVQWVPGCTREDDDLYSYRRDHQTGRFAGVVVLRSGGGPG
jgi:YfiH family protein